MKRIISSLAAPIAALFVLSLPACEASKSSNPLSPSVAGPIPGVEITTPKLLEPAQGIRLREAQQPIRLLIENSSSTGVRPLSYTFEVATDNGFSTRVFARSAVPPGEGGRTSLQIDKLDLGRTYFWRVRAEDGANSSAYAASQFEVLPKAQLGAPAAIYPVNNDRVDTRRPTFRVRNAERNAAIGAVRYEFQLSTNQTFTALVAWLDGAEGPGETQFALPSDLNHDVSHFWRVRASDGETTSDWMTTQTFRTPLGAPAPGPTGPAPGGTGGPCVSGSPLVSVQCERAKFPGFMSGSQMLQFMRNTARSLNSNGIWPGGFGVLRKTGGHNCGGYSCDVICSGQGGGQRQWDALSDIDGAQEPTWSGPNTLPSIRVDVCEVQ
jgi:hypothetical protein